MSLPNCPKCQSEYTYQDGDLLICPECSHEWKEGEALVTEEQEVIKDANGNVLADGDSVTVIKDLKIKGSSSVVKVGTKVKSIRLVPDASEENTPALPPNIGIFSIDFFKQWFQFDFLVIHILKPSICRSHIVLTRPLPLLGQL